MGGDEPLGTYEAIQGGAVESVITVSRFDEAEGIAEGTFEATFVVKPSFFGSTYRRLPDTLYVTEGRFRLPIRDIR